MLESRQPIPRQSHSYTVEMLKGPDGTVKFDRKPVEPTEKDVALLSLTFTHTRRKLSEELGVPLETLKRHIKGSRHRLRNSDIEAAPVEPKALAEDLANDQTIEEIAAKYGTDGFAVAKAIVDHGITGEAKRKDLDTEQPRPPRLPRQRTKRVRLYKAPEPKNYEQDVEFVIENVTKTSKEMGEIYNVHESTILREKAKAKEMLSTLKTGMLWIDREELRKAFQAGKTSAEICDQFNVEPEILAYEVVRHSLNLRNIHIEPPNVRIKSIKSSPERTDRVNKAKKTPPDRAAKPLFVSPQSPKSEFTIKKAPNFSIQERSWLTQYHTYIAEGHTPEEAQHRSSLIYPDLPTWKVNRLLLFLDSTELNID